MKKNDKAETFKATAEVSTKAIDKDISGHSLTPYTTTVKIDGLTYEQHYYEPLHPYDKFAVKRIKVIAFDDQNRVLGISNKSQVDIVNGSLTWEDDTAEDAARREAREEGNVTLDQVCLAAVIESNHKRGPFKDISYTLVMAARVKSIDPYQPWHGRHKRLFLTRENLLKRFSLQKAKDLAKLIDMAEFVLSDKAEIEDHMRYILQNF